MYLSDQIIRVLDDICSKFGLVFDWTSENVVPYITMLCTKLVAYEIWTSAAWIIISLIILVSLTMIFIKNRTGLKGDYADEIFVVLFTIFSVVFGGAAIAGIISQIMDIIKCVTFPEMFVAEYIHNLISNVS